MPIHYGSAEIVRFPQDDLGACVNVYLVPAAVHRPWMSETNGMRCARGSSAQRLSATAV